MKKNNVKKILFPILVFIIVVQSHADAKDTNKFVGAMYSVWFDHVMAVTGGSYPDIIGDTYPAIYPTDVSIGDWRYWGEPAAGRYSSKDNATITRHAVELSQLGLDFIFIDLSNIGGFESHHHNAVVALLNNYKDRLDHGKPFPKVAFLFTLNAAKDQLVEAYNKYYSKYDSEIFFHIGGKPLVLANIGRQTEPFLESDDGCGGIPYEDKYTCKPTWGGGQARIDKTWSFSQFTPQNIYKSNGWSEEIPVNPAQQFGTMTAVGAHGRRYDIDTGQNDGVEGKNLQDQWKEANKSSPTFVLIKAYNEWVASKFSTPSSTCGTAPNRVAGYCFVDEYNREFSNDIEPMMACGPGPNCDSHGDLYFNLMQQHIEKYKSTAANFVLRNAVSGEWSFRFGRGAKNTSEENYSAVFSWAQGAGYQMLSGDFDHDGHNDIGLRNKNTGLWHFAFNNNSNNSNNSNNYDNGYSNTRNFSWAAGSHYQPLVGDFNGDGETDIALRNSTTGRWHFAFFDGVNNYVHSRNYDWAAGSDYQPVVGDFNGNGKTDIALRNTTNGRWHFAFFNGVNSYQNTRNFDWSVGANFQAFAGDFNCDGIHDIGLRNTDLGTIHLANFDSSNSLYYNAHGYQWDLGADIDIDIDQTQCN